MIIQSGQKYMCRWHTRVFYHDSHIIMNLAITLPSYIYIYIYIAISIYVCSMNMHACALKICINIHCRSAPFKSTLHFKNQFLTMYKNVEMTQS